MRKVYLPLIIVFVSILISISLFLGSDNKKISKAILTKEQRLEDFNYLYNIIENQYPYTDILKNNFNIDIVAQKNDFKEKAINAKNDEEFLFVIYEILESLQDVHTTVWTKTIFDNNKEYYKDLNVLNKDLLNDNKVNDLYLKPISDSFVFLNRKVLSLPIKYIDGDYFFYYDNNKDKFEIPEGAKILSINNKDLNLFLQEYSSTNLYIYDNLNKKYYIDFSCFLLDKSLENLTLKYEVNGEVFEKLLFVDDFKYSSYSTSEKNTSWINIDNYTAYIKIKSFDNYDIDKYDIEQIFKNIGSKDNLIIDIRDNGGGQPLYWKGVLQYILDKDYENPLKGISKAHPRNNMEFDLKNIEEDSLAKYKNSNFEYSIGLNNTFKATEKNSPFKNIYILVNEGCFSTSESFVEFIKANKIGKLVGRPTGGNLFSGFLDKLPNSNLVFQHSAFLELNSKNEPIKINPTMPDIIIKDNVEDTIRYAKNPTIENDTVLRTLLEKIKRGI